MGDQLMMATRAFPLRIDAERALREVYRDQWPCLIRETAHERLYRMEDLLAVRGCRDPHAATVLPGLFGLHLEDAATFRRTESVGGRPMFVTAQHTWALEPIARGLFESAGSRAVLLHVDAHDDLQSPSVFVSSGKVEFRAPVGDDTLDMNDSDAIARFVQRGLVGIGGFIAPLLHLFDALEYVHVVPSGADAGHGRKMLERWTEPVLFFSGAGDRPAVRLTNAAQPEGNAIVATTLDAIDEFTADTRVFLDIDFDYFCNTYDDSVPALEAVPSAGSVKGAMSCFFDELESRLSGCRIECVTLALSPGFFPALFWEDALDVATGACRRLLTRPRDAQLGSHS